MQNLVNNSFFDLLFIAGGFYWLTNWRLKKIESTIETIMKQLDEIRFHYAK
jgi:hypothetical protein